ncbi:ATP-binding cassette domain-containing protein [Bifidobacterium castoris]|uniref:ABC transporter ATP-binding protein n=1 Tax=Bifidobacterium castoris TaxID=2306972 RepID=A0A430F5R3_9BIFI|nr:ATP-binding cassette domain-containing protein [Bifidobacterium castoris]RSX46853.1 ABC transporter ATP-binding protein [Bifidobacterium castoris]
MTDEHTTTPEQDADEAVTDTAATTTADNTTDASSDATAVADTTASAAEASATDATAVLDDPTAVSDDALSVTYTIDYDDAPGISIDGTSGVEDLAASADGDTDDNDATAHNADAGTADNADADTDADTADGGAATLSASVSATLDQEIRHGSRDADDAVFRAYPMLAFDGVGVNDRKTGEHIWDDLTLRCEAGRSYAVLVDRDDDRRHNTLVAMLTGFLTPTRGRVLTKTTSFAELSPLELRGHRIGAILAMWPLRLELSAADNLIYTMDASGRNFLKPIPVVAQDLLRAVGFGAADTDDGTDDADAIETADRSRTRVRDLDAVDAARVAVARAIANDPDIVIADEPTARLDDADAATILDLLRAQLHTDAKARTVIVVTADPQVAAHLDETIDLR